MSLDPEPPPPRRPVVLVVDDDDVLRAAMTAWLEQDHEVLQAPDGDAALELAELHDPDVVLMDVMMPPGPDGIETCRRLKARDGERYRPVLLLTAMDDQERRNAGLAAGADDFLGKPVDRQELTLRVRAFLRLREQDRQIRRQLEELRRLDAMKADLVELVTHDLMNALTGLILMMESIQYTGAPCTPEELATLHAAAGNMRETIEDMRRIKAFEDGVLVPSESPVTLADVVSGAVALAEPGARARSVSLVPRVDARAVVHGDAVLLRRSVYNLLEYAVKGSPRGSSVELRARTVGANAEIEVHDRGASMAEDAREHLFEKFTAVVGPSPTGRGRGHRLGLFLVDLVAKAHGGEVSVSPRVDGGASYRFVIPVKR